MRAAAIPATLLTLAALLTLALACGAPESEPGRDGATPAPPAAPPDPAPPPIAETEPSPPVVPAPPVEPPPTAAPAFACITGDVARGEGHYTTLCASCHGTGGDGQGPAAAGLNPKPARHNDGTSMNGLENDYLFQVIKEGGASVGKSPLMAPWGGALEDLQIWDVVAYVRSLAAPPYACP